MSASDKVSCPVCDGGGFLDPCEGCQWPSTYCTDCTDERPCSLCNGTGRLSVEELARYDPAMSSGGFP